MAAEIITFWSTLIRLATQFGKAKQAYGEDSWQAVQAEERLREYEAVCLRDDASMVLGMRPPEGPRAA